MIHERPYRRLLYGGTFDPIHTAHVLVAEAAGQLVGADIVSLVPAADPPHKRHGAHASAADRLEMVRRAVDGHPLLDVLDVEVRRGGVSYTIDTVEWLLSGPGAGEEILLLLGQDALDILPQWHRAEDLVRLVRIVIAPRRGAAEAPWQRLRAAFGSEVVDGLRGHVLATPTEAISSTLVRQRAAAGKSIRCWVPHAVADYIAQRHLYSTGGAGAAGSETRTG